MKSKDFRCLHLSHSSSALDGGIATAVRSLTAYQQSLGLGPVWLTADRFQSTQRDRALCDEVLLSKTHLMHIHGLWRAPTRIACRLVSMTGSPLVISPHGMLDPGALAISRRKKQLVWHLWERRSFDSACCVHALCEQEASAIRLMLPRVPIAVIPNGVDSPSLSVSSSTNPPWSDVIPDGDHILLYFGRFHSKKGIDPLLRAWQSVSSDAELHRFWLVFVGYGDDGALSARVAKAHSCGELERVRVFGPIFGAQKAVALSSATAFVLSSFSEGLPMAALEAMAYRLPCLLSNACNLPEAFAVGAAVPVEPDPVALAVSLKNFFRLSKNDREKMGLIGQSLVSERFSWPMVASQTRELYSWVLGGGDPPSFVMLG